MKRYSFISPSYSKTMMPCYDFWVPSIKNALYFTQFIKQKKATVERHIDVDSAVEYDKKDSFIAWSPYLTEKWKYKGNTIETTIVLGNLQYLEIWFDATINTDTGKPKLGKIKNLYSRELSAKIHLSDYIEIAYPNKYKKELFRISPGNNLGAEILNAQDQIEDILKVQKDEIFDSFDSMLSALMEIKGSITYDFQYK